VLDVGCGTGVLTEEMAGFTGAEVVGVDIDQDLLWLARKRYPRINFLFGDACNLPFESGAFDATVSHLLFMWLRTPEVALSEMIRVTRKGGLVAALCEPDFEGRVEVPEDLPYKACLIRTIHREGGDPFIGRKLKGLFTGAGLRTEFGVNPFVWRDEDLRREFDEEWNENRLVLSQMFDPVHVEAIRRKEEEALLNGRRVVYLPLFYALGVVEEPSSI
jgi:SAM-dependent methyltransferase